MIRMVFIFILLLLAAWLGVQLHQDSGYVLVSINHWTIETTLWVAVPSLILLFIILHLGLVFFHTIMQAPTAWRQWLLARKNEKNQTKARQESLAQLYEEVGDWSQLMALLPTLKKQKILSKHAFKTTQKRTYLNYFAQLTQQNQAQAIAKFVKDLPKELRQDPDIIATYTHFLIKNNQHEKAEALLKKALQKQINSQLLDLYAQINIEHSNASFIQSLLKKYPHSAEINLCLGRLCVQRQLWGKAKAYFEESVKLGATVATYAEYGHLLDMLNDKSGACDAYRKGLDINNS